MKVLQLFVMGMILLYGADNYELKLYEKVLPLFFKSEPIAVYADDEVAKILKKSAKFHLVTSCEEDTVVIVGSAFEHLSPLCKKKPIFATSYRAYMHYKNSFGAFYWRKGRPQLKFKKEVLDGFGMHIPKDLVRYVEE